LRRRKLQVSMILTICLKNVSCDGTVFNEGSIQSTLADGQSCRPSMSNFPATISDMQRSTILCVETCYL
jgi:hypothetical protein